MLKQTKRYIEADVRLRSHVQHCKLLPTDLINVNVSSSSSCSSTSTWNAKVYFSPCRTLRSHWRAKWALRSSSASDLTHMHLSFRVLVSEHDFPLMKSTGAWPGGCVFARFCSKLTSDHCLLLVCLLHR